MRAHASAIAGPEDLSLEEVDKQLELLDEEEEPEEQEEEEGDAEEPALRVEAPPAQPAQRKRGPPQTYSYPWPRHRRPDEGVPRFIPYADYVKAATTVEAEHRVTYKRLIAIKYGVNFDTCLRLLPYWDVVRCFAMDVLHDIYLGPVRVALEETFGRENLSDTDPKNVARQFRLPKSVGALVSKAYSALHGQMPSERKLNLSSPHSKHQFYKGA